MIEELESANKQKQKINMKYASQVKGMNSNVSIDARNKAYENLGGAAAAGHTGLGGGSIIGSGLDNYQSMP